MTFTDQKIILVFTDWYLPGYKAGGPIRSLVNLVNAVPHRFYIVTGNKDHHSDTKYEDVKFDCWTAHNDRISVQYLSDDRINAGVFKRILQEIQPEYVYLNSLFSPRFTLLPMRVLRSLNKPPKTIVAPRGMLKAGALSVKGFKKKWFLRLARLFKWYADVNWHATNEDEIKEIQNVFGENARVFLSPNLSAPLPVGKARQEKQAGDLRLVSIARISPEKGILDAIHFLKGAQLEGNIHCDFIGTQQNADYLRMCIEAAAEIPNAVIRFPGEIHPDEIQHTLCDYHFFLLATWGENFGHSISEALHSGLPVIISNKTPWRNLEEKKAGWVLPLEQSAFTVALRRAMDMAQDEYELWSESARAFGEATSADPKRIQLAIELFQN